MTLLARPQDARSREKCSCHFLQVLMQDLCEIYARFMRDVQDFYARDHLLGAVQVPKENQSAKIVEGSSPIVVLFSSFPTYIHTYLYVQVCTFSLISRKNRPARQDWDLARKPTHPSRTVE